MVVRQIDGKIAFYDCKVMRWWQNLKFASPCIIIQFN